jgi:hypothetical protein
MEHPVLHARLPSAPWMVPAQRRLPGVQPLDMSDWLIVDEAYGGQMALRDRSSRRSASTCWPAPRAPRPPRARRWRRCWRICPRVSHATAPGSRGPTVRSWTFLATRRSPSPGGWCRRTSASSKGPRGADEHLLSAAILCFPASWTLAEKIGRPLGAIHGPGAGLRSRHGRPRAAHVRRDPPGAPLWRQNALLYASPDLHQPRSEAAPRAEGHLDTPYLRSERQCLLRLPRPGRSCSRSTPTCCPSLP